MWSEHVIAAAERRAGIYAVMGQQGAEIADSIETSWWPEPAYEAVGEYLEGNRPTALICLNDRIALGAYQAVSDAGLVIPDDLSVVSFDDSDLASWMRPGLSSLALRISSWAAGPSRSCCRTIGRPRSSAWQCHCANAAPLPVHPCANGHGAPGPRSDPPLPERAGQPVRPSRRRTSPTADGRPPADPRHGAAEIARGSGRRPMGWSRERSR